MTVLLGIWLSHDAGQYNDDGYKNELRAEVQELLIAKLLQHGGVR